MTHEITYGVIIPFSNSNQTEEDLITFCDNYNINFSSFTLKYRFRNLRIISSYYKIIKDIKLNNPDIIYFVNFDNFYLNVILSMLNPCKTIIAFHDVENHSGVKFNYVNTISKKILITNFKHFHTFSSIQQNLLNTIIPNKKIHNIPLPLTDFGPSYNLSKKANTVNFLFFGNILYYKGLDILITAFNNIAIRYPNAYLTIAGRCDNWNEEYEPLIKVFTQIKLNIGFIDNAQIADYFCNTDYLVLPYRDTTQSGPLMISYNYNIPVLVSDIDGFKEFTCDGITGYSFELGKENGLETVMGACVERSENEYNNLKHNLCEYVENNFSISIIVDKYKSMFDNTINI